MSEADTAKTGYVIIAHGALAREMLGALEFITGNKPNFRAVAIDHAVDVDKAREIVKDAIGEVMGERGVIVLTDLFGGAPSNIVMSLLDEMDVEIVAGVNMPILIQAGAMDEELPLKEKALRLQKYGKDNIFMVSEVLSGRKKIAKEQSKG
ncbi:MAG: PTS sugar transporter subunit IIA [Candidatus Nitrospinota bacterium M3_3B_026]